MGLGAYLAAVTDREHFKNEAAREKREVAEKPGAEKEEIFDIFADYGITREASQGVVDCLVANEDNWIRVHFTDDFSRRGRITTCDYVADVL